MNLEDDSDAIEFSDLTAGDLLTENGNLRGGSLFERAGIPEAERPAEELIERLAAVPGGSARGRAEAIDAFLEGGSDPESSLAEIIADAARKLGALDWALDEVLSEWQMTRWALDERLRGLERERQECEARLSRLPDAEEIAPKLQRAGQVAQEELAGLIAFLDGYRLGLRRERRESEESGGPAFARPGNVIRLLEKQTGERTEKSDKKAA